MAIVQQSSPQEPQRIRGGVLTRRELADFIRQTGERLGFRLQSNEFNSVRDTGVGLHIGRRLHRYTTMGLQLDLQPSWAEAYLCWTGYDADTNSYFAVHTVVEHFEHGDITTTTTAEGSPKTFTPEEGSVYGCADPDEENDRDPDTDYGSSTGPPTITNSTPLDTSSLRGAAIGALYDDGGPVLSGAWEWTRELTPDGIGVTAVRDTVHSVIMDPADVAITLALWSRFSDYHVRANRSRYRWRNTSPVTIEITWTASGATHSLILVSGETSDWIDSTVPVSCFTDDPANIDAITDLGIVVPV